MTSPSADSLDELAEIWASHCEVRFEATAREAERTCLLISSASTRSDDIPSRHEIVKHLKALSKSRAPGISGLPLELSLGSQEAMDDLSTIVQLAFKGEQVPTDMVLGEFLMIWKGKSSKEECAQYRPIVLEEVACKLISSLMLVRLSREVGESRIYLDGLAHVDAHVASGKTGSNQTGPVKNIYLPITQAGFRKGRSTTQWEL